MSNFITTASTSFIYTLTFTYPASVRKLWNKRIQTVQVPI